MATRILAAALSASLLLAGCQAPDGQVDWGSTLLLGAGIGAAALLVAGAASDNHHPRHHAGGYGSGYGGRGYGYGYGRPAQRGW
jgi:hypothetical protein